MGIKPIKAHVLKGMQVGGLYELINRSSLERGQELIGANPKFQGYNLKVKELKIVFRGGLLKNTTPEAVESGEGYDVTIRTKISGSGCTIM